MVYTSYFSKIKKMSPEQKARCVSIARFTPKGVDIPQHIYLAPSKDILFRYKQDGDKEAYTKSYLNYLETLDASRIVKNLEGKILCCYEKPGDFCHRHILAEWLKEHGADCEELQ